MSGTHTQGREIKSEHSLSHTTGEAEWPLGRLSGHWGDQVTTWEAEWPPGRPSGYWGG